MIKNKIKLSTVTNPKMIPLAVYIQNMVTFCTDSVISYFHGSPVAQW